MIESDLNTCVLIMSCDKYEDLWQPFFYFFDKYWSDCPYPVYLATNTKVYQRKQLHHVHSKLFGTWSEETAMILNQLPHKTIIYLQDDYFILKNVDTLKVASLIHKMRDYKADYLRLFPSPGPDCDFKQEADLGLIDIDAKYRTSLQAALWNKDSFLKILSKSESQWEFETMPSERTAELLFLSIKPQTKGSIKHHIYPVTYYYLTAVIRGKWRWGIKKICRKEGVILDFNRRECESYKNFLYQSFYDGSPALIKKGLDFIRSKWNTIP